MAQEFRTFLSKSLKRRGLRGTVIVQLNDTGLAVTDETGKVVEIAVSDIERLRAGVDRTNKGGPFHEARLRLSGETRPVLFAVRRADLAGYLAVMGGLAERLAPERLETGLSGRGRMIWLGLMGLPLIMGLVVWAVALRAEPLWQGLTVCVLPAIVLGLVWNSTRGWTPHPARNLASFKAALAG